MKTIVNLIVPFTFSDEKEYIVNLDSKPAKIRISHFKNNDAIEKIKGIKYQGNPRMVPDDPEGIMCVSNIEIELPYSPEELEDLKPNFDPVILMINICMKYLNRLIEVVRFATRRYWIKSISIKDLDVYRIDKEEDNRRFPYVSLLIYTPQGYDFEFPIRPESTKKNLIKAMLGKEQKIMLSNNLLLDALNLFYSGKFSESIITTNIFLEVFVHEFLYEKFLSEGKSSTEASELSDKYFKGKFHSTMTHTFFRNLTIDQKHIHPMWNKFDEIRIKRKQVIHPNIKKINYSDAHKVISNAIELQSWILDLSRC